MFIKCCVYARYKLICRRPCWEQNRPEGGERGSCVLCKRAHVEGKHVQRSWGSPMPGALEGQQGVRCAGAECTGVRELEEVRTGRQQDLVGHGEESGRVNRPQGVHWLRSPSRAAMRVQVVPWGHGMAPKSINPVGVGAVGRSRLVLNTGERCWAQGPRWAGQAARDCPGPSPSWLPASAGRAVPAPDPIRPGS